MLDCRTQYLGLMTFPFTLTAAEIVEVFALDGDVAQVVGARRTSLTRLGLVLQIGFLRLTGRTLNSVQVIPPAVLASAGRAAGIAAPQLASIRSIYRRRMTLYHHQQAAMAALGFKDYGEASERALTGHLRRMATQCFDSTALIRQAMTWLYAHHWVLPGQSRIEDRVAAAQTYVTKSLRAQITQATDSQFVQRWVQDLSAVHDEGTGETLFEWLRKPATGTSQTNIEEAALRLDALRNLPPATSACAKTACGFPSLRRLAKVRASRLRAKPCSRRSALSSYPTFSSRSMPLTAIGVSLQDP